MQSLSPSWTTILILQELKSFIGLALPLVHVDANRCERGVGPMDDRWPVGIIGVHFQNMRELQSKSLVWSIHCR